jgi:hypothetical protein
MRRRDFITLIGTAAVWPATAIAQQNNKKWLIGIITVFKRQGNDTGLHRVSRAVTGAGLG